VLLAIAILSGHERCTVFDHDSNEQTTHWCRLHSSDWMASISPKRPAPIGQATSAIGHQVFAIDGN
jgi:hypothetical protein